MSKFRSQVKAFQQIFIGGAVLAISLNWPSISAAQTKSDQAKDPNPHAQHQEKQPAGGQDASGQMPGMKMQGMTALA